MEKPKTAGAGVALQSALRKAAREKMKNHTAEIAKIQKQLAAKGTELSQLSANCSELTDEFNCVKSQSATGSTAMDHQKLIAGNCDGPNKRARVARHCK